MYHLFLFTASEDSHFIWAGDIFPNLNMKHLHYSDVYNKSTAHK